MGEFWTLLFRFSFGLLCHSVLFYLMTDRRYSRRVTLGVWLGAFALTSLAVVPLLLFVKNVNIVFVIEPFATLAIYCAVYLWLSKGSVWRSLYVFFAYATFFFFSLTLCSCVSQMFFEGSHWATVAGRTAFMGLYTLWLVRRRPAGPGAFSGYTEKSWTCLATFSVFSGLTVYITALSFMILKVDVGIRLAVSAVLFLLIGSAYLVANRTITLLNREHEAKKAEAQRKLLESQLDAEQAFVDQARTHRHDLRHHMNLIAAYLEQEDLDGAKAYLSQYRAELDADTLDVYCENAVVNALLRHTARRCGGSGISFTCRAAVPRELSITGPEVTTVLGNILENACEASRRCKDPWISVTLRVQGDTLLVGVKNAVAGETRFADGLPVSTKPGGGLGLKSVSRVLEKYDGVLQCRRMGDTFITQAAISLEFAAPERPEP